MNFWITATVFASALILSLALVPLTRMFSIRTGLGLDKPDLFRKGHQRATSRLGGIPIVLAWVGTLIWMIPIIDAVELEEIGKVILCSLLMFGLGLTDDFRPLGAKIKLVVQLCIACLAWVIGLRIELLWYSGIGALSFPLTVAWLVVIPNIINLVDGMDGLSGGITLTLCITLAIMSATMGQISVCLMAVAVAGAILGFLVFNLPPARIFMGDAGAYFIGFLIAGLSIASESKTGVAAALLVVGVALGVPILDTAFAILRRGMRGVSIFRADKEHIHHKLRILGFSNSSSLIIMYGVSVFLALIALTVIWTNGATLPVAVSAVVLLGVIGARFLGYIGHWSDLREQVTRAWNRRKDLQYANLLGGVLELENHRLEEDEVGLYWERFRDSLRRVGFVTFEQSPPESDAFVRLKVHLRAQEYWIIHYVPGELNRGSECWGRIAEAFLPALSMGMVRWRKHPLPVWLEMHDDAPAKAEEIVDSAPLKSGQI